MRLYFDYQGETVLSIETDPINNTTIPSDSYGSYSDAEGYKDYSEDPENPVDVPVQVNSMSATPRLVNPDSRHAARISTELTINNDRIVDEHNGIRLLVDLTHSGNNHTFTIHRLEKFGGYNAQGQESWTSLWNLGMGSIAVSWDTNQEEEGYLFAYEGLVTDKYNQNPNVPSIGFQLGTGHLGTFTGISSTIFYQQTIMNPIPNDSHSYLPTDNQVNIGGTGNGSYPADAPESLASQIAGRNAVFNNNSTNGYGIVWYEISSSALSDIIAQLYFSAATTSEVGGGGNGSVTLRDIYFIVARHFPTILDFARSCVIGCWMVPYFEQTHGPIVNAIKVGDLAISTTAQAIENRLQYKHFGTCFLQDSGWDDWNDFENTTASLYLPFVGRINIDMHHIARGSITIEGVCDVFNGNVCYWITCTNCFDTITHVYNAYTGNAAIELPIAGVQNHTLETIMSQTLPSLGGTIVNGGTGNFAGALSAGATAISGLSDSKRNFSIDGSTNVSSSTATLVPWQPRLDIQRKNIIRPEHYKEMKGIPVGSSGVAASYIGSGGRFFCAPDTIIEAQNGMTATEAKALKILLAEGVYL